MTIPISSFISDFFLPPHIQQQYDLISRFRGAFNHCLKPFTNPAERAMLYQKPMEGLPPANPYPVLLFQAAGLYPKRQLCLTAIHPLANDVLHRMCDSDKSFTLRNLTMDNIPSIESITFHFGHTLAWTPHTITYPIYYSLTDWLALEAGTHEFELWNQAAENPDALAQLLQNKLNLQLEQEIGRYLTHEPMPLGTLNSWGIRHEKPFYDDRKGKKRYFICIDIQFELPYYLPGGIALGYHKTFGFGRLTLL